MPLRELPRLLSGQSSWKRWRFIFVQLAMVAGIIGCTYGEVWLLNMLLDWLRTVVPTTSRLLVLPQARPVMILAASGAFISLAMVIIGVHVLRLAMRYRRKALAAVEIVARSASGTASRAVDA